jgi:hypothetical protein
VTTISVSFLQEYLSVTLGRFPNPLHVLENDGSKV